MNQLDDYLYELRILRQHLPHGDGISRVGIVLSQVLAILQGDNCISAKQIDDVQVICSLYASSNLETVELTQAISKQVEILVLGKVMML